MRRLALIAFVLFAALLPQLRIIPEFWITLLNYIGLSSLVAIGLVLLTGVGGMTSFGQAAFVGFGAYTAAVMSGQYGLSPWLALPVAIAITVVGALIIGALTVRLSGHYLPLGTLAWGTAFFFLFGNLHFLGAHDGLNGLPPLSIGPWSLIDGRAYYYVIWITVLGAVTATLNLLDSRIGRSIRALRGGAIAAQSFGVDTARAKLTIFVYAAVLAAVSGWLYAHLQRSVSPGAFGLNAGIEYLLMAVVGGAGSVPGAILGAGIVTVLKDQLQNILPKLFGTAGNFEGIVFGLLLVIMLQSARDGLWPLLLRLAPAPAPEAAPAAAAALTRRVPAAAGARLLDVRGARKTFGGLVAVNDVSFHLDAGEIVGLIGPNGAGKSTMFNLITGVSPATGGNVSFLGEEITHLPPRLIARRGIARTFQHVKITPDMSVLDNAALGAHLRGGAGLVPALARLDRREEGRLLADAAEQLRRVGLGGLLRRPAGSLALGQLRTLEIARALALDPALLLLDEPAAGLRHLEKRALADLLRGLRASGVSVLLVEHDMDFVMGLTDRLVVLDFGVKIAEGPPEAMRRHPAVIEAYLGGVA